MTFPSKLILTVALPVAGFLAGHWLRTPGPGGVSASERRPLYYHDPMHPAYRSDKPGIAPDCGMALEPVYAEGASGADSGEGERAPGTVRISLEKQQVLGLRTAKAVRSPGSHTVRLLGKVAADETRQHRVTALMDGVVHSVSEVFAGSAVKPDELLAAYTVSSGDLFNALQSYLVALGNRERLVAQNNNADYLEATRSQLKLSEELLRSYGVSETQLKEMAAKRVVTRDIAFRSPAAGIVLTRNISLGQRVDRGTEVFRIADLSQVWVLADVFENDGGALPPGSQARIRYRGVTLPARVAASLPQYDAASRTLKVRLEVANPELLLRPDMFVSVERDVAEAAGLTVPLDAVIDSGRRKTVFVAVAGGVFEPREVIAGPAFGDRVPILKGLEEGESVVISSLFLLDSESRLQMAAQATKPAAMPMPMAAGTSDPVCGMGVDPAKTTHKSQFEGATLYFCSEDCKGKFDANPAKYTKKKQSHEMAEGGRP